MPKSFYPNDHGFLVNYRGMVYKACCRYKYDVTYMIMTSSTSAARFLLRPTVALVDRDYQFYTRRYLSSKIDDEMSFLMSIYTRRRFQSQYMYRSYEVFRPFLAYMASWMAF